MAEKLDPRDSESSWVLAGSEVRVGNSQSRPSLLEVCWATSQNWGPHALGPLGQPPRAGDPREHPPEPTWGCRQRGAHGGQG